MTGRIKSLSSKTVSGLVLGFFSHFFGFIGSKVSAGPVFLRVIKPVLIVIKPVLTVIKPVLTVIKPPGFITVRAHRCFDSRSETLIFNVQNLVIQR